MKDMGDYAGALAFSERALGIFQIALPQGHPHIQQVSAIYEAIKQQHAAQVQA